MSRSDVTDLRAEARTRSTRRCGLCRSRAAASRRRRQHTHVALAYESILIVLSGFIGAIGLASLLHAEWFRGVSWSSAERSLPALPDAWSVKPPRAAQTPGARQRFIGHAAAFATGTLAMAQVERSANRIAGLDEDRPPVRRSVVAALLAATVGVLLGLGGLLLCAGRAIASGIGWTKEAQTVWSFARWPIGFIVVAFAVFLLFHMAPRWPGRSPPGRSLPL